MREYHAGQVAWAVVARLSTLQYTLFRAVLQSGDLLALKTNKFISHLEKTLGLVLRRKTLGLRKKGV
jgi:hypothetical protein